jgi:CheY-like chemotaxis protein
MNVSEQNIQEQKSLIMVVDDNPDFLSAIELTLEMEGFRVVTASHGQHALDILKSAFEAETRSASGVKRLPDLILADIMMPVMDGYVLYERVRANPFLNHIPFIFLTAKSADEDVRYGKELGIDDYLSKLSPPEVVHASIRGRLKRVEQQRALAAQFTGDPSKPIEGGSTIAIAIIVTIIIIAFALGAVLTYLLGG